MSKSYEEIAADIVITVIGKAPSSGNLKTDADRAAEAFKIIFSAVQQVAE